MSPDEPCITVNGTHLSEGQAMSVRVAVESFLMSLDDTEHMTALEQMGSLYQARLREVEALMLAEVKP